MLPRVILKEFALQPEAFESAQDVREAMGKFSFAEGRLICGVPEDWSGRVLEILNQLPSGESNTAKRYLKRLQDCGVVSAKSSFAGIDSNDWIEYVNQTILEGTLDGGIVRRGVTHEERDPRIMDFDQFFANCPSGREGQIYTTQDDYASACQRLIELGPRVVLVDPYFGLHDFKAQRGELLKRLIRIGQAGKCDHFEIFSSKSETLYKVRKGKDGGERYVGPEEFDRNAAEAMRGLNGREVVVDFTVVEPVDRSNRQHDRYLITQRGGIDLRIGFELRWESRKAVISMVDREPHEALCKKWLDGNHGFKIERRIRWSDGEIRVLNGRGPQPRSG